MKKIELNKKLQLKKETIANLSKSQLESVKGGSPFSIGKCTQSLCWTTGCGLCFCIGNGNA